MADINTFACTGRLVENPELRYTPAGKAVCNMRLAINGVKEEDVTWLGAVAWERTAETANQYLQKGDKVGFSGRLQTRSWETQDGQKRQTIELVVERLSLIQPKRDDGQQGGRQNQGNQQQRSGNQQQRGGQQQQQRSSQGQSNQRPNQRPSNQQQSSGWGSDDGFDTDDLSVDEIPF